MDFFQKPTIESLQFGNSNPNFEIPLKGWLQEIRVDGAQNSPNNLVNLCPFIKKPISSKIL